MEVFLISLIYSFTSVYLITKILDRSYDWLSFLFTICILPFSVCIFFFWRNLSLFLHLFCFFFGIFLFYKRAFREAVFAVFIFLFLQIFLDILFSFAILSFFPSFSPNEFLFQILFSLLFFFILVFGIQTSMGIRIRHFLFKQKISYFSILFLWFFLFLLSFSFFQGNLYYPEANLFFIFANLGIFSLTLVLLSEKAKEERLLFQYHQILSQMEEYELLVDTMRKNQHEFCNQLLCIQSMSHEKKIQDFIDRILKQEQEDVDQELLQKISKVPMSLQGLLYFKLFPLKKQNITLQLEVSVSKKYLNQITEKDCSDLGRLLAIYLDNAVDALKMTEERNLSIAIFQESQEFVVFSVANTFQTTLNIEDILKNHRTTKGIGHGYGLLHAEEIIKENTRLIQETEWVSNIFIQTIKLKL